MVAVEALESCELFAGLSREELAEVATLAQEHTYGPGETIFAEYDPAEELYILSSGRVEVRIRLRPLGEAEAEVTLEEMEPGRIFGWSSLVRLQRFTASVQALEPVHVLVIRAQDLDALFERNAHLGFVVMRQLAEVIASRLRRTRAVAQQPARC